MTGNQILKMYNPDFVWAARSSAYSSKSDSYESANLNFRRLFKMATRGIATNNAPGVMPERMATLYKALVEQTLYFITIDDSHIDRKELLGAIKSKLRWRWKAYRCSGVYVE